MAVNYGQVAIVPKGAWNAETQYKVNNLVSYDGSSYVAKVQPPVGTLPTDTSYWQVSAAGTKKATADSLGTVMPDGTTTSVGEDGKLSVNTAQQDALGVVKGSDDITVGEDGTLTVNTTFEQATELANIIAGEAIKSVLGKVSKAIATTMSLDENALLKNMISGIDVNDSNKVPSSAYIHTLVERIGMGTELVSGLGDLTTGLNTVNNNLSNNLYKAAYTDDIFITTDRPMFVYWDGNTKNTPYKSGLTSCTEGFAFSYGAWAGYMTVVCFVKNDSTMWIWSKSRNAWVEYAAKSDLEPVKSRQINTYTSANKDTDATLSSYESKTENFILLFTSDDTTGTIPTLTGSHLFVIEHLLVGEDSASAIERAYSTKGKLIAWRFKQWWNKTWTAWENS